MIGGVHINYYFHCHRQLWLYAKYARMEQSSEDVRTGKVISENSYDRHTHEVRIVTDDAHVVFDFVDAKNKIVHEVKKSTRMRELHEWQIKYYLYVLKKLGLEGFKGVIRYPKQRKIVEISLTEDDVKNIEEALKGIEKVLSASKPPPVIKKPYCRSCSYYEFCYC